MDATDITHRVFLRTAVFCHPFFVMELKGLEALYQTRSVCIAYHWVSTKKMSNQFAQLGESGCGVSDIFVIEHAATEQQRWENHGKTFILSRSHDQARDKWMIMLLQIRVVTVKG